MFISASDSVSCLGTVRSCQTGVVSNIKAIEEDAASGGLRCILCVHVLNSMEHLAPRWAVMCVCAQYGIEAGCWDFVAQS